MNLILSILLMTAFIYLSMKASRKKKEESRSEAPKGIFSEFFLTDPVKDTESEIDRGPGMTDQRLKHSIGVARRCREIAMEKNLDEISCQRLFLLGFLHDIGYEFSDERTHAGYGSELLDTISFPFSQEVLLHGQPLPCSKQSQELRILNQADIETALNGNPCSPEEKLKEIAGIYGSESEYYKNTSDLISILKLDEKKS